MSWFLPQSLPRPCSRPGSGGAWRNEKRDQAPRGSRACETNREAVGCSGRDAREAHSTRSLDASTSSALRHWNPPTRPYTFPHRKRYAQLSEILLCSFVSHSDMRTGNREAQLLPGDAQIKWINAQLPCWQGLPF